MISVLFRNAWIPELRLIRAKETRLATFNRALYRPSIFIWSAAIGVASVSPLLYWLKPLSAAIRSLGDTVAGSLAFPLLLLGALTLGDAAFILIFRSRVRRIVRKMLADQGIPVCIHCGYDLTGNASGICSECGTPCPSFGRAAKDAPC